MKEYDVVILKVDLQNVPKGTTGTIVYAYPNSEYEVEFILPNGSTIVEKVIYNQIK